MRTSEKIVLIDKKEKSDVRFAIKITTADQLAKQQLRYKK